MQVRFFHDGNVVTYDPAHARYAFVSTYAHDWGLQPASGEPYVASFHESVGPSFTNVYRSSHVDGCNEVLHGGASYPVVWPYDMDFWSLCTVPLRGEPSWDCWAIGLELAGSRWYVAALDHWTWEP
jgi:hypothetical protein